MSARVIMPLVSYDEGHQKLDRRGMHATIAGLLEERIAATWREWPLLTPEGILELDGELRNGRIRPGELRTVHELRKKDIPLLEGSYVGSVRADYFELTVRQLLDYAIRELKLEQNHMKWALVAARIELRGTNRQVAGGEMAAPPAATFNLAMEKKPVAQELHVRRQWTETRDGWAVLHLVYADALGADPRDPNAGIEGAGRSEMGNYADSRMLKDMPQGLQENRAEADTMVREAYDLPPLHAQMSELLARLRGNETLLAPEKVDRWPLDSSPIPAPAPVPPPEPRPRAPMLVETGIPMSADPAIDTRVEIAKRMLIENAPIGKVMKASGLTKEEVEKLAEEVAS